MRLSGILLLGAALLAGCAGYHLGPVNGAVAGEKSIEILPFNNQTLAAAPRRRRHPGVARTLQTDGTYHLDTRRDRPMSSSPVSSRAIIASG